PSFSAIRQAGYASGLETRLSQPQLMALWLETVDMGRSPNGWVRGFYQASRSLYNRAPAQLDDAQFLHLVAVATTPSRLQLNSANTAVKARTEQILRTIERHCADARGAPDASGFCKRG
ncbi:MAG: hypothetical protein EON59_18540, partial [Alphaproteobacteria bacterium]